MKHQTGISIKPVLVLVAIIIVAGCTSGPVTPPASDSDILLSQGEKEFSDNNLHAAYRLFVLARENYTADGKTDLALHARNRATIARMMTLEFPYNRSQIEPIIDEKFPGIPAERKASWLPCNQSQCIESDGETWYYDETVANIQWHNMDIMRNLTAKRGETPYYDQLIPVAFAPADPGAGNYVNPMNWEGTGMLSIPSDALPKSGTLRLWVPLPIKTESQRNVTIVSVEPAEYVRSQTGTDADIGIVYLEIPLENRTGRFTNISTIFRFTSYGQRFNINPENVTAYNTSDPDYLKYTAPSRNIALTPGLEEEAIRIVGNETNPYRKAQKIYRHVTSLYYGHPPYARNLANGTGQPMSEVVRTTGYGDCGAQSNYFAALCRAAGIPARATGGEQMVPGYAGRHIWSEYYLPGYGWIPNDVTVAEGAEWSYNATDAQRQQFKEYYSENLDPYRYIIQKSTDTPLIPDTKDLTMSVGAFQEPIGMCDTCAVDPKFWIPGYWKVTIKPV